MTTPGTTLPVTPTRPPAVGDHAAALAAGPLLALSSGLQLVTDVQRSDGEVLQPALYTGLTALWVAGMLAVAVAVRGLVRRHRSAGLDLGRRGRAGHRLLVAGAALQVLFALAAATTALVSGAPAEAVFLLFALGFLALVVGGALLGSRVRRSGLVPRAGIALQAGAVLAVLTIVVSVDPWHDVALFGYDLSWSLVGLMLLRSRDARAGAGV